MSDSANTADLSVDLNVAIIRGTVSSEPRQRDLPSGSTVINVEVTTHLDDVTCSVPVVVHDRPITVSAGDEVVVTGRVARRFFRAGGVVQSRTELVATTMIKATRRRAVERAVRAAIADVG